MIHRDLCYFLAVRRTKYTREFLEAAVGQSTSFADVLRNVGIRSRGGGTHSLVATRIRQLGISTAHFQTPQSLPTRQRSPESILVRTAGNNRITAKLLRRALIGVGVPHACVECGLGESWRGKPLRLHVDHINGDWSDCRQSNLRFLCPNCHSQTPTFGSANHKQDRRPNQFATGVRGCFSAAGPSSSGLASESTVRLNARPPVAPVATRSRGQKTSSCGR